MTLGQPIKNYLAHADTYFSSAEAKSKEFRKFWYLNSKQLGDILEKKEAYKIITLTLNNLGLLNKLKKNFTNAVKYFKETLEIEAAVLTV